MRTLLMVFAVFNLCTACQDETELPRYDLQAAGTSLKEVQEAVDRAENGYLILIPPGNSTWSAPLIIPDEKQLILYGSGSDETIISSADNAPASLINMGNSDSRITAMGFSLSNNNGNGIRTGGHGWRIDHCRFTNTIEQSIEGIMIWGSSPDRTCPTGVIDHCEFNNTRMKSIQTQ